MVKIVYAVAQLVKNGLHPSLVVFQIAQDPHVSLAVDIGAKSVGSVVHGAGAGRLDGARAAQSLIEGTCLSLYRFSEYRKPEKIHRIRTFSIVEQEKAKAQEFAKAAVLGKILADSQNTARDLINEPANNLTPEKLLKRIKKILNSLGLRKKSRVSAWTRKRLRIWA